MGNVIGHGIQKTRTTPAGNGKHLHILTFIGGRASVCRIICAIRDCLDTPGMLEDQPVPGGLLILAFGELIENLTRRRNDLLILKKVRFVTLPSVGIRCVYRWPILTLLLKLPVTTGQTRTMWYDQLHPRELRKTFYQQQKPHAHVSAGAVHDTKYLSVKHFSWGNLAFLSWWYMPQSIFPPADIRRDNVLETEYFTDNYVDNVNSPVIDIAHLSAILDDDLL